MKKLFGLLLLLPIGVFAQSPWIKKKGKGYTQISYNVINEYNSLFVSSGKSYTLSRSLTDRTIQFYGEYGMGNDWQLSTILPYKLLATGDIVPNPTIKSSASKGNYSALGNIEVAIKKNFIDRKFLFSGQLKAELPTSSLDEDTGLRSGLDAVSITPSLTIGRGWKKMYGYLSVGSAIRSNNYSGNLSISGEFGTQPIHKLWIILALDVVSSFENATPKIDVVQKQTGLFLNNQEYFAYGLKAIYQITNEWGINAGFYGASSGNLVAKSPSLNFGIYYQW